MSIVAKFGGSSLADAPHFQQVKHIIETTKPLVVVPSAPGKAHSKDHKVTELLYMCHQLASHGLNFDEVFDLVSKRYRDLVEILHIDISLDAIFMEVKEAIQNGASRDFTASRGEYINGLILAKYLGYRFIDATDLIRFTPDGTYDPGKTCALVASIITGEEPVVVPGFYGADNSGCIHTFSRGGSDITGAILAACLDAECYENWTDVSGFLVADPHIVPHARPMAKVSYRELRELSYMGAMVLHEEAIFPVREKGIPIHIKNTNAPDDEGTFIVPELGPMSGHQVTGIAGKQGFVVFTVEKTFLSEELGFLRKLLSVFETNNVSIAHIPSGIDHVSVIVKEADVVGKEKKIQEEIAIYCHPEDVKVYRNLALIAVVGRGMISTKGVSAKIFAAMAEHGVNVRMIIQGASELNIIVGVENEDMETAIAAIYSAFDEKE